MNNEPISTEPQPQEAPKADKPQVSKGGRNLVLLGIFAVVFAFLTTFISLKIYHDSGDIYLDRSRPGFLPEKEETEEKDDADDYVFPDSGKLTQEALDEYLDNLKQEIQRIDEFTADPFGPTPLLDSILGL